MKVPWPKTARGSAPFAPEPASNPAPSPSDSPRRPPAQGPTCPPEPRSPDGAHRPQAVEFSSLGFRSN
jgi:hypothetical protein